MTYKRDGFQILSLPKIIDDVAALKSDFQHRYFDRFSKDPELNRNIIKRFADCPGVSRIFDNVELLERISEAAGIDSPVFCGPIVTHYTSDDLTGSSYALPFHQDYPSMASSKNSVIVWTSITPSGPETHGVEICKSEDPFKLVDGSQTDHGYVVHKQEYHHSELVIPSISPGEVLIMSPYLIHRTYLNENFAGWKLSLSRRLDDFDDQSWATKKYGNAYLNIVDRNKFLTG